MGIPSLCRRRRNDPSPKLMPSLCFESHCTKSTAKKADKPEEVDGRFFSIVSLKISNLNIIMSGEVDCASSKHFGQSADHSLLIHISSRGGASPAAQLGGLP